MCFGETSVGFWVDKLSGQIDACDACQPHEDGEVVWTEGDPQSLLEILEDAGVPEDLQYEVAQELHCSCGNDLQLDSDVVADSISAQIDEEAGERFVWWAVEDNPRFKFFDEHLRSAPGDGRSHELGQQLYEQMKSLKTSTVTGDWWRASSFDRSITPTVSELGPPPTPSTVGGRFNPSGLRTFYLGSDRSAAINEASKYRKDGRKIWLQQFKVSGVESVVELTAPKTPSDAFYDSALPSLFAGLLWCNGLVQQREGDEQAIQYLLPQFIAQCAVELGIHGVLFNSLLHAGSNLVLFTWDESNVTAVGLPELAD